MTLIHFKGNIRIEVDYDPALRRVDEIKSISVNDVEILNDLSEIGVADQMVDSIDWPEVYAIDMEPVEPF
jgi:hypothetical protein